jgi:hypothetical protein
MPTTSHQTKACASAQKNDMLVFRLLDPDTCPRPPPVVATGLRWRNRCRAPPVASTALGVQGSRVSFSHREEQTQAVPNVEGAAGVDQDRRGEKAEHTSMPTEAGPAVSIV